MPHAGWRIVPVVLQEQLQVAACQPPHSIAIVQGQRLTGRERPFPAIGAEEVCNLIAPCIDFIHLYTNELPVFAFHAHEFAVTTPLDNLAPLHDDDFIAVPDRAEPMGHNQAAAPPAPDVVDHALLRLRVQRTAIRLIAVIAMPMTVKVAS